MSVRTNFWKKLKNKKVYNFVSTVQRERDTFRNIGLSPKFGSGYTVVSRSSTLLMKCLFTTHTQRPRGAQFCQKRVI